MELKISAERLWKLFDLGVVYAAALYGAWMGADASNNHENLPSRVIIGASLGIAWGTAVTEFPQITAVLTLVGSGAYGIYIRRIDQIKEENSCGCHRR